LKKLFVLFVGILMWSGLAMGQEKLSVGLVMSSGGLGTGFNQMAYEALTKLEQEGSIDFKYVEPVNVSEDLDYLRDFSGSGEYDLIIAMGSVVAESLKEVVKNYPEQRYALIGATLELHNTITVDFAEHEMSFMAGSLAAMMSENNKVGTIPAMDTKSFNRFKNGFRQGAQYVNKDVKVYNTYMPTTSSNPFNDPVTGKNISQLMIDRGVDVIMHIAEGSGRGLFEAAKANGTYAIGCDVDEDGEVPGTILTSVRVRIDNAVYNIVSDVMAGEFQPGYKMAGLAEGAVSLTDFNYTRDAIGEERLAKLQKIEEDIIAGKIEISQ